MSATATNANIPAPTAPFLQPNGQISPAWWAFLLALFNRSGGTGTPVDLTALKKQINDLFTLDAGQVDSASTGALMKRIEELEQTVAGLQPTPPVNGTVIVLG